MTSLSAGYRADGLRAWKEVGGERTYFLYVGTTLLCELSGTDGAVTSYNTWGPTGLLNRTDLAAGSEVWYLFDPQGNVSQRLDGAGKFLSADRYDPWGNLLAGGDPSDPYGYHAQDGYYTDHETGLILCTFRYYDPQAGRWLTKDPIGFDGGVNLYAYCGNDPIGFSDPLGLERNYSDWSLFQNYFDYDMLWRVPWAAVKGAASLTLMPITNNIYAANKINELNARGWTGGNIWCITKSDSSALAKGLFDTVTFGGFDQGDWDPDKFANSALAYGLLGYGGGKAVLGKMRGVGAGTQPSGITGYTNHGLNQAIGRNGGRGVSAKAMLDAIKNPQNIVYQAERGTWIFKGGKATVILTQDGRVVTTFGKARGPMIWPNSP